MTEIKLPLVDPQQPLDGRALLDLPPLLQDPDARDVATEILFLVWEASRGKSVTVGQAHQAIEEFTRDERRALLEVARHRAGLPSLDEVRHANWEKTHIPDTRPLELVAKPGGALVSLTDIQDGTRRERVRQASVAAERQAQAAERAIEARAMREHEQAIADELRRHLPRGVPG